MTQARHILVHSIYAPPEFIGIAKYTGETVEHLLRNGHEISLVTSAPYYPQWKTWENFTNKNWSIEREHALTVFRCPFWLPKKLSGLKKLIHLLSYAITSFPITVWQLIRFKPEAFIILYPYLFVAPYAILLTKLLRPKCKIWIHVQDFELDAAFDLGLIKSNLIKKIGLSFERTIFKHADIASSISPKMMLRLADKGISPEKSYYFPNWIDTQQIHPIPKQTSRLLCSLNIPDTPIIALYSGNMGDKQGLEIIIATAKQLSDHNILFLLFGDGSSKASLMDSALGMDNVRFYPLQPTELLNDLLNLADIHLLPQRADAADLVMPSKLLGMLASGRPVVATAPAGTQLATTLVNSGIVTHPGDADAFAQAILTLAQNESLRIELGQSARQLVIDHWEQAAVLKNFSDKLNDLISTT